MSDSTFRTPVEQPTPVPEKSMESQPGISQTQLEPPFTDYEQAHGHPYVVEHYELGDTWKERMGGFMPEVQAITTYLMRQIGTKEMDNSVDAVRETIKRLERVANVKKSDRVVSKIAKVAAYVEFLNKVDGAKWR
jgi:hypothetical protein